MSNSDSPLSSAAPTKRKRSARFKFIVAASVLIGLPLLLYSGLWALVNFGFFNHSIAEHIAKKMGATARIGPIKSDLWRNLSVQNISIQPSASGNALTIGATKIDYDLIDMLRNNHMRGLTVERPCIDLRFDPKKGWNHTLQLPPESGDTFRIDKIEVHEGTFSFIGPSDIPFKMSRINLAFDQGTRENPGLFSFSSTLESSETITTEVKSHPDGSLDGHLLGALIFERDAAAFVGSDSGLRGWARLELNAKREAQVPGQDRQAPIVIDGMFRTSVGALGEFAPPDFKLSGPISAQITTENGSARSAVIKAEFKGDSAAQLALMDLFKAPAPKTTATIQTKFERDAKGVWTTTCEATDVSIPLAAAGRAMRLLENFSVKLEGGFIGKVIRFYPATGVASGRCRLSAVAVCYVIPQSVLAEASKAFSASGHESYALALNTLSQSGVKNISGDFVVSAENGDVSINGHVAQFTAFATTLGVDFDIFTFPATDVVIESNESPDGTCAVHFTATWDSGKLVAEMHSTLDGKWTYDARFNDSVLASELRFEGAFDPVNKIAGPSHLSTDSFKASSLGAVLKSMSKMDLTDSKAEVRGIRVRIEPFSLDPHKPHAVSARVSLDSATGESFTVSKQNVLLDADTTGLFLRSPFEWTDGGKARRVEPQRIDLLKLLKGEP